MSFKRLKSPNGRKNSAYDMPIIWPILVLFCTVTLSETAPPNDGEQPNNFELENFVDRTVIVPGFVVFSRYS